MHVRLGQLEDAEKIAALAIQVWLHTYATEGISSTIATYVRSEFTAEKFVSRLAEESSAVFIAEVDKNLVGYAVCDASTSCPVTTDARVELLTLYVQEHFGTRGIGSSLLKQAELWAKQRAGSPMWLTVNSENSRAKTFYAKHGYTSVGITYFRLGQEDHENQVLVGPDA